MRKSKAMFSILAVVALAATALFIGATSASADPVSKVTICHRTNSDTNPYVEITPDVSGVLDGHDKKHDEPFIWTPTLKAQHQKWGDVIPEFDYIDKNGDLQHFGGLNLDTLGGPDGTTTGADLLDNGCSFTEGPPPDTGSLEVTKTVTGTLPDGVPADFTIHVFCDDSGVDEDVVFGPTGDLAIGETKTFDDLLSGDTCTVSEDAATGFPTGTVVTFDVDGVLSTPVPASVDVEIPDDDTVSVTVDNDFPEVGPETVVTPTEPVTPTVVVAPAAVSAAPAFTG